MKSELLTTQRFLQPHPLGRFFSLLGGVATLSLACVLTACQESTSAPEAGASETAVAEDSDAGEAEHDHADGDGHNHDGHNHGSAGDGDATATLASTTASGPAPAASQEVGAGDGPARLGVDRREHDFGAAIEGEVLTHVFKLKSEGKEPLVITQAKPTCGCTVGRLVVKDDSGSWIPYSFGDPIAVGQEFEMEAALNTRNKKSTAHSKINVSCNDPRGMVALDLKATVSPYFTVAPANLDFKEISLADRPNGEFTVRGKGAEPFMLKLEDRPFPDGLKVELAAVEPNAEGKAPTWKVMVAVEEGVREGRIGYPIHLLSDQAIEGAPAQADGTETVYTTTAMVSAVVKGLISHNPQYLSFGLLRPGQVASRSLRIDSNDAEYTFPADLGLKIEAPGEPGKESPHAKYFSTVVRPSSDNKYVDVELTLNGLPEDMGKSSFQGKLVIQTGHASKPQIEVLFSGVCRASTGNVNVKKSAGTGK